MTEPKAMAANCEHHYATRILGGHPINVRACTLCQTPDWNDLMEQAIELHRWGWQEGRAGKPARERLSAYEKPREAHGGELAGQDGDSAPQAAPGGSLRQLIIAALASRQGGTTWDALADAVLGAVQPELDAVEHGRQMAVESFAIYRNDAQQLHAALAEVLDAFEAYWSHASYCGPGETAIQQGHFHAWRAILQPETLDGCYAETRRADSALDRVRALIAEHPVTVGTHLLEEALDQGGDDEPSP